MPGQRRESRLSPAPVSSNPHTPRQNPEATRIGPYVLGKTLGVGSTGLCCFDAGRVKLAVHMEKNTKVAVKIINKPAATEDKAQTTQMKMELEITIMKLITHPNILQLYDVYDSPKNLYLMHSA